MAGIADIAVAPLSTAANYYLQRDAAARNQQYYRENIAENFKYSQQAQRNAAANEVIGLRNAGLSPVLANGAAGASQVSAQGGTMQAPSFDPSNLLLMAQIKNLEAQTDKTKAEAANVEQQTGERETAGRTYSLNLYNMFQNLAETYKDDPAKSKFYQDMSIEARDSGKYAAAAADALRGFQNLEAEGYESRERILKARVLSLVEEGQLKKLFPHGDYFSDLVDKPRRESNEIAARIAKFAADKENLEALKLLTQSQTDLNKEQKAQVEAMRKRLEDYNIAEYIKKGDSLGALAAFLGLCLEAIAGLPGHANVSQSIK